MFVDSNGPSQEAAETRRKIDHNWESSPITPDAIRVLTQQLSSPGRPGEVAVQTFTAMGAVAVPALIDVLVSGNRVAREHAARALGRIGAGAQAAIPALTKALQDSHPWVQEEAAQALAKIESAAEPLVRPEPNRVNEPPVVVQNQQPTPGTAHINTTGQHVVAKGMPRAMKTYRNEHHGFELVIPADWSPVPSVALKLIVHLSTSASAWDTKDTFQYGCRNEAFNFVIGPLLPMPPLEDTELEFRLYAQNQEYTDLEFGRITVGGKEHVWASYHIQDRWGRRWNKKYMLVFGGTEYSITATCSDPIWFAQREKDWDAIVSSFRLLVPVDDPAGSTGEASIYLGRRRESVEERLTRREITGTLYGRAYEAVAEGRYSEARRLLEKCLCENPDHVLAHKELAVVLKKKGSMKGALRHRQEVKRLAPSDTVNRVNLADLLAGLGYKREALQEAEELLALEPNNPRFQELKASLVDRRRPNFQITFFCCLSVLLGTDVGLWTGLLAVKNTLCMGLLMLLPACGLYVSGPWMGIPPRMSALLAIVLLLPYVAILLLKG
jgi:tetratricopeptide (TPR) repeat protein